MPQNLVVYIVLPFCIDALFASGGGDISAPAHIDLDGFVSLKAFRREDLHRLDMGLCITCVSCLLASALL